MKMINGWVVGLWVDTKQVISLGVRDKISAMRSMDHLEVILEEDGFVPSGLSRNEISPKLPENAILRHFAHPEKGVYALVAAMPKEPCSS